MDNPNKNIQTDYTRNNFSRSSENSTVFIENAISGHSQMDIPSQRNQLLYTDDEPVTIVQSADTPEDFCAQTINDVFSFSPNEDASYHFSDHDLTYDVDEEEIDESYSTTYAAGTTDTYSRKHSFAGAFFNGLLVFITVLAAFYLVVVYSSIPFISTLRNKYIETAMATLNHKYLATALFPSEIIDELMLRQYESEYNAIGLSSTWGNVTTQALPSFSDTTTDTPEHTPSEEQTVSQNPTDIIIENEDGEGRNYSNEDERIFFERFYEIDYDSMQEYVSMHPEALAYGWANVNINAAGLEDDGTSILTTKGDQVLAINASEGIVLIRVYINSSRGVMAICKDTSRISLCPASTLGTIGQTAGRICEANDGILAITGSAFMDDGSGDGGQISGLAVCSGYYYGDRLGGTDKRIELRSDNRMYIVDSVSSVDESTRDACEFRPALIIDGEVVVDEDCGWTGPNPRSVLGQSAKLETMMFILEGRLTDSPGDSVVDIAYLMQSYGCVQALNLDGGTSSIMYYDGEYITRCSNTALPGGRTLPSAWVYRRS